MTRIELTPGQTLKQNGEVRGRVENKNLSSGYERTRNLSGIEIKNIPQREVKEGDYLEEQTDGSYVFKEKENPGFLSWLFGSDDSTKTEAPSSSSSSDTSTKETSASSRTEDKGASSPGTIKIELTPGQTVKSDGEVQGRVENRNLSSGYERTRYYSVGDVKNAPNGPSKEGDYLEKQPDGTYVYKSKEEPGFFSWIFG